MGGTGSGDRVGHPFYGNQHGTGRATPKVKTPGIKQWSGKINKQFAKKIEIDPKTPKEIVDDIYSQMSELTEITGITPEKFDTYERQFGMGRYTSLGETERPSKPERLGMDREATKAFVKENSTIDYVKNSTLLEHQIEEARQRGDYGYASTLREKSDLLENKKGYVGKTYVGNGVRNPVIDHEFFHYMSIVRQHPEGHPPKATGANWLFEAKERMTDCAIACQRFMKETKVSYYGATAVSNAEIPYEEGSAETYAYWKAGNEIPEDIEKVFLDMESGDIYGKRGL